MMVFTEVGQWGLWTIEAEAEALEDEDSVLVGVTIYSDPNQPYYGGRMALDTGCFWSDSILYEDYEPDPDFLAKIRQLVDRCEDQADDYMEGLK
jgi:hypothetical protein